MSVETHIHHALDRVQDEQMHIVEKQTAFDRFEREVRDIPACSTSQQSGAVHTPAGGALTAAVSTVAATGRTSDDRWQEVRKAFAETIRPYSITDLDDSESLLETIEEELGTELAITLSPKTNSQITPTTKQAILSAMSERQTELEVMTQALDAEEQSLRSVAAVITDIINWLVEANETSLSSFGFDELQTHHETLASHRTQCDQIARDRQVFLNATTSLNADVGLAHRTLGNYLYAELPVNYPVLVTSTRLDGICADCQRVVRNHLVRRV